MYVSIDEREFNKLKPELKRQAMEDFKGDENVEHLLLFNEDIEPEYEFDNGNINLNIDSKLGFFSIGFDLTDDQMLEIVRHLRKKAEKLKEMISLAE